MEHGSLTDSTSSTFSIMEEDHTLANSARFVLNQDPRVAFCGYSIPHPAEKKVNIRVQTTGDAAKDVLKDALQNLMIMCQHVRGTLDNAVANHRAKNTTAEEMDVDRK
ncbi:DNA-directed RNA polymerases I and III subunit RPAC2-like [Miscanthus floridulus]|uniref:DNA-directed RNA polymerases I and III subunit RPAC2-like n=1 Tax=Miscanthus floridulus TaxID=154761 RepID=UPI0034580E5B